MKLWFFYRPPGIRNKTTTFNQGNNEIPLPFAVPGNKAAAGKEQLP
jgi:hypothetical protein